MYRRYYNNDMHANVLKAAKSIYRGVMLNNFNDATMQLILFELKE